MVNRSRRLLVMGGWTEDVPLLLILRLGGWQRKVSSKSNGFIWKRKLRKGKKKKKRHCFLWPVALLWASDKKKIRNRKHNLSHCSCLQIVWSGFWFNFLSFFFFFFPIVSEFRTTKIALSSYCKSPSAFFISGWTRAFHFMHYWPRDRTVIPQSEQKLWKVNEEGQHRAVVLVVVTF